MRQEEAGVPPLAFVQLLNSDALQPDAVAHFRRLVRREGWSELELVRRDRQVPIPDLRIGATHSLGGTGGTCTFTILERR